jgi:hypothetical protein
MTEVPPNINFSYVSLPQLVRIWSKTFRNMKTVFGRWLLVFSSISSACLPYRLRVSRLRSLNEYHLVL